MGRRWISDGDEYDHVAREFLSDTSFHTRLGLDTSPVGPSNRDESFITDAWRSLSLQEPRLNDIATVLVTSLFSLPRPRQSGSGSLASLPGVIYLHPTPDWSSQNGVEALVRELTHQMLWNDEHRFGHYPHPIPTLALGDIVRTSVGDERVSLPRALANLVVTAEILTYRDRHRTEDDHFRDNAALTTRSFFTMRSLRDIPNIKNLTTGRFWRVANAANQVIADRRVFR